MISQHWKRGKPPPRISGTSENLATLRISRVERLEMKGRLADGTLENRSNRSNLPPNHTREAVL
jgi:hypothetical protein